MPSAAAAALYSAQYGSLAPTTPIFTGSAAEPLPSVMALLAASVGAAFELFVAMAMPATTAMTTAAMAAMMAMSLPRFFGAAMRGVWSDMGVEPFETAAVCGWSIQLQRASARPEIA